MARPRIYTSFVLLIICLCNLKILRAQDTGELNPNGVTIFPIDTTGLGRNGEKRVCDKVGVMHIAPEDCSIYYQCGTCNSTSGWCYSQLDCGYGKTFDDISKICVYSPVCPQSLPVLPSGWVCKVDEELKANPEMCNEYYVCVPCGKSDNGWCYWKAACPEGTVFDETTYHCNVGVCPEKETIPIDENGVGPNGERRVCNGSGELNVVPEDCSKYYECNSCASQSGWCYNPKQCQDGEHFEEVTSTCVTGPCPKSSLLGELSPMCPNQYTNLCDWYSICKPHNNGCSCRLLYCGPSMYYNRVSESCQVGQSPYSDCQHSTG